VYLMVYDLRSKCK